MFVPAIGIVCGIALLYDVAATDPPVWTPSWRCAMGEPT